MINKNLRLTIPPGTADIFGENMRIREHVLNIIKRMYMQFGFEPLLTPAIENAVVFNGHHGEGEKILFNFCDKKNNPLVLRYDLTVPLARVMGMYPNIPRPFKRYQIATAFRDDSPDNSHFREFVQCDADIIGISDLVADAEVIIMAACGLKYIVFNSYRIRVNHREILRGIAEYIRGYDGCDVIAFQRSIDFADKVLRGGINGIKKDLAAKGFEPGAINKLIPVLDLEGDPLNVLERISSMLSSFDSVKRGVSELSTILSYLPEEVYSKVVVDFTLARGADYYTGFILEGVISDINVGAVLGGGRYDNLMEAAGGNKEPAVGMAFGLDRIVVAMQELSMSVEDENPTLLIFGLCKHTVVDIAYRLRELGVMVDFNPNVRNSSEAKEYAQKRNYPAFAECSDKGIVEVIPLKEGLHQFFDFVHESIFAIKES